MTRGILHATGTYLGMPTGDVPATLNDDGSIDVHTDEPVHLSPETVHNLMGPGPFAWKFTPEKGSR